MDLVVEHCRYLRRRNMRPSTIAQRDYTLRRVRGHAAKALIHLTADDIEAWLDSRHLCPQSRATAISHLRGFYAWTMEVGYTSTNPAAKVERPKLRRRLPRPMPEHDVEIALRLAPEPIRLALHLAAYAGLRACEIAPLRGEDCLLDQAPPLVIIQAAKGGDMATVPLAPVLSGLLATHSRQGWLFPRRDGLSGPWLPHRLGQIVNRYLHGLGITHTLHTLRHWFGTHTYRATGRDVRATQELLRHRSVASTAIYTWVDPGDLSRAVNRLPVFGETQPALWG